MMRAMVTRGIAVLVVLSFLTVGAAGERAMARAEEPGPGLYVVESGPERIVLEWITPAYGIESYRLDGSDYQRIEADGLDQTSLAGQPQLPVRAALVGIPPGAVVSVGRVEDDAALVPGSYRFAPAPSMVVDWQGTPEERLDLAGPALAGTHLALQPDPQVYGQNGLYPAAVAAVSDPAQLRQQPLAAVQIYPFRWNPVSGELRASRRILIELVLSYPEGQARADRAAAWQEPPQVEAVLRDNLLNYDAAKNWRVPATVSRSVASSWAPPDPGYRVSVQGSGIVELGQPALDDAGVPVASVDPRKLRLMHDGQEVAIYVHGEADGSFDAGDHVLFYAGGVDTKWTLKDVYWLTYGTAGDADGLRMGSRDGTPSGTAAVPTDFQWTARFEQNKSYWSKFPGTDDTDRFYWSYSNPTTARVFDAPGLHPSVATSATLTTTLVGYTHLPYVTPDHHVRLLVNGQAVGEDWWDGAETFFTSTHEFTHSVLADGLNQVTLVVPGDAGSASELVLMDRFELSYRSAYTADADSLVFAADTPGRWEYNVAGYSVSDVEVLDITTPTHPVRILNPVANGAAGSYTLRFENEHAAGPIRFLGAATAERLVLTSDDVVEDTTSDWAGAGHGADEIIIAPQAFHAALAGLVAHRQTQELRVALVDLQDIYDEFSYGLVDARAIRDMLRYAYENWERPAPVSVLLVGDGHYDFKNLYGANYPNPIPPYLARVDPWIGETATDNRYVCVSGDDIMPDMNLGRWPANTVADVQAMVANVLDYEQAPANQPWQKTMTFVTDNPDDAGNFYEFSDDIVDLVSDGYQVKRIYLQDLETPGGTCATAAACKAELLSSMNVTGTLLVNYIGHAATKSWASEKIWASEDIPGLTNAGKLPVFLPMTCWDGWHVAFSDAAQSNGERVVRVAGKGAIASWSGTGLGVASGHDPLNQGFVERIFTDDVRQLGPATLEGKLRLFTLGANLDLMDTYVLFGDPETTVPALQPDLQVSKGIEPQNGLEPGDVLTYTLTFTNAGPGVAHNVVLTDILPAGLVNPTVVLSSAAVISQHAGVTFAWDITPLLPGDGGQVQVRAVVDPAVVNGFRLTNQATITATTLDSEPSNNSAVVHRGVLLPDLYVTKTGSGTVSYGQAVTYTIAWGNAGTVTGSDVVLTDTLPAGMSYVGDNSPWAATFPAAGVVAWDVGEVPAGAGGTFVLTGWLPLEPPVASPLVNRVAIGGSVLDGNPDDDTATASSYLSALDLVVGKTGPAEARLGTTIAYQLTYANAGTLAAAGVVLTDTLPAGLAYVSDNSGLAHSEPQPGVHVWQVGTLGAGAQGQFQMVVLVEDLPLSGTVSTNRVTIGSPDAEIGPGPNQAEWPLTVLWARVYLPIITRAYGP